jgi:hypothetical protein
MKTDDPRTAGAAISRMPRPVRDAVSRCLQDGGDWKAVRDICKAAGHPGVRAQNVTNYRKGAHKEWLAKEERIEAMRRNSEATREAIQFYAANGGNPAEAGLLAAAEMMQKVITDMGFESFRIMAADKPEIVFKMLKELRGFSALLTQKSATLPDAPATPDKETLTPEQRTAALKQIFGLPA